MTVTISLERLEADIEEFIAFKRALGYSYNRNEYTLNNFLRFANSYAGKIRRTRKIAIDHVIKAWISRNKIRKSVAVAADLSAVRELCKFICRRSPGFYIPEHELAPWLPTKFKPYVFSKAEVKLLLQEARTHQLRNISPCTLYNLLLILYCTGMRFGEALRLQLSDLDSDNLMFVIHESKGRTRYIPFGDDLLAKIQPYLLERGKIISTSGTVDVGAMFVRTNGTPLSVKIASTAIRRLLRKLELKPSEGRVGPRPYDLRHTFAVHRLTEWYQQGVNIHARLPWLSAYMGHVNVMGTETYLHATEDLLQIASQRFENRFEDIRHER